MLLFRRNKRIRKLIRTNTGGCCASRQLAKRGWMSFIINLLGTIEIEESKIYLNLKPRWRRDCRLFLRCLSGLTSLSSCSFGTRAWDKKHRIKQSQNYNNFLSSDLFWSTRITLRVDTLVPRADDGRVYPRKASGSWKDALIRRYPIRTTLKIRFKNSYWGERNMEWTETSY